MANNKILIPLVIVAAAYFLTKGGSSGSGATDKRAALLKWNMDNTTDNQSTITRYDSIFKSMSQNEIDIVYDWVFNRINRTGLSEITTKYDIFS